MSNKFKFTIFIILSGFFLNPVCFGDDDLEKQMIEMQKQSEAIVKQLEQFQKNKKSAEQEENQIQEGQSTQADLSALNADEMDLEKTFVMMQKQFQNMPYSELRQHVDETMRQTPMMNSVINRVPKVVDFMAHLYQDPSAFPRMLKIIKDRDKLKDVGLYMLATLIFGWLLGKVLFKPGLSFYTRMKLGFYRFVLIWTIRIGILVHFYGYYLGPTAKIFKKVFLKQFLIS